MRGSLYPCRSRSRYCHLHYGSNCHCASALARQWMPVRSCAVNCATPATDTATDTATATTATAVAIEDQKYEQKQGQE
jgi:hypothetical protein